MPDIHPTAVVDRNAKLADDVRVGAYSVIGPRAVIGKGTVIGVHCVIENDTTIGAYNRVFHHVCLGQLPQDLKFRGESARLVIGDHNDIRENVTMHIGTENGGGLTSVGDHNFIMCGAHVAHDCHVRSHTILSNNVLLAGHVIVEDYAVLSGGAALSHYVRVGRYAFIGGLAGVVHDCPPFLRCDGHPARVRGINTTHLTRHKFDAETLDRLKSAYMLMYGRKANSLAVALEEAEAKYGDDPRVMELLNAVREMSEAPNGRHLETQRPDDKRKTTPR
ncbi:MAG: acyl-ACP--UDP-N-acetylglucosamine O-acyltransferase [Phycisphaera sp.]|nr:acyl-ACP--UDP-N-acetylglucosamine O-acyltransferase [Phycisphaera sp.]